MNFRKALTLAALLAVHLPAAAETDDLLTPEEAFPLSAVRAKNGDILLVFDVAPGYALYKERIVVTGGDRIAQVVKPAGLRHEDEYFGVQEQYRDKAVIRVVPKARWAPLELKVRSQGCADVGVCYNPQTRTIRIP